MRVLGVVEGLDGLGHDSVVGRHHQDDDVGHSGAAGAHGAEGGVARGVQKSDPLDLALAFGMGKGNGVGADVLGDASGLPGGDIGLADDIQQRRLAVVHMAHDGHDRRARAHLLALVLHVQFHLFLHFVDGAAAAHALFHLEPETELGADLAGDLLLHRLVDTGKNSQFHQLFNDLERLAFQVFGQVAHDDGRLERDQFAGGRRHDFVLRLGRRGGRARSGRRLLGRPLSLSRVRRRADGSSAAHAANIAASSKIGPALLEAGAPGGFFGGGARGGFGRQLHEPDFLPQLGHGWRRWRKGRRRGQFRGWRRNHERGQEDWGCFGNRRRRLGHRHRGNRRRGDDDLRPNGFRRRSCGRRRGRRRSRGL